MECEHHLVLSANVVIFRPSHTRDGCTGEQIQLRRRRLLLLVLRGPAVLPLRVAAERAAAARGGALLAGGGAQRHVLGALPGARSRRAAAPRPPPGLCPHRHRHTVSDSLDTSFTSSECARYEVIVLR